MSSALYVVDGDVAIPSAWTAGPWSPDAQHGGPVAALLARTIESVGGPPSLAVVRITVELQRPVPMRPLTLQAGISRPGRRVDVVDAELYDHHTLLARARALRIRTEDVGLPATVVAMAQPPVTPTDPAAAAPRPPTQWQWTTFHLDAMEMRLVAGSWDRPGPAVVWQRLRVPLVEGESPSGLQRAVAAADSGNGISRVVAFEEFSFINPDLTVALSRPPVGEWIGADARTRLNAEGWGQAESLLFDPGGPCGRAIQSLIVTAIERSPG